MTSRISIPTFLGGISQQAHGQRQSNLVDDALNVEFLATEGATKRYPTEHVAEIFATPLEGRVFTLERDDATFVVLISDDAVRVFDMDGTPVTVTPGAGGYTYLSGAAETDFRAISVADALFVLNRSQVVAGAAGPVGPTWKEPGEAYLFVKAANYGVKYTVTIQTSSMGAEEVIEYSLPSEPGSQDNIMFGASGSYDNGSISAAQAAGTAPFTVGFDFQAPGSCQFRKDGGPGFMDSAEFRGDPRTKEFYYEGTSLSAGDRLEIRPFEHNFNWFLQTDQVIKSLRKRLEAQVPSLTFDFETIDGSPVLRLYDTVDSIDVFKVSDSQADTFLVGWQDEISKFSDLPLDAKHGQVVRVVGLTADAADDYTVRFATTEWAKETDRDFDLFDTYSGFGPGTWIETTTPDLATGDVDPATMPHVLQRTGPATFTWGPADWTARDAGDDESNPEPSFIGEQIRDIFWHQNRLGFLAQNSVILSESAEQFNFWRTTVLSIPDSDPIDIDLADLDGDVVNHAVSFQDRLLVFSREAQAAVFGSPVLTPTTVAAPVISRYRSFVDVPPVQAGQSLFFGYSSGQFAQFREYIPTQQQNQFVDATITVAAPKLIPSNVRKVSRASVDQQLAVLTYDDLSIMYLYQYYRQGNDLLQASWTRWQFNGDIVDISYIQDTMVLVLVRDGVTYLETMQLGVGRTESAGNSIARLDRRALLSSLNGVYDISTDLTSFTLPYAFDDATDMRLAASTGAEFPFGAEFIPTESVGASGVLRFSGDISGQAMYAGENYSSEMSLSRPYAKMDTRTGSSQILGAAQTVRNLHVALSNTGYMRAEVEYVGSPGASEEFLTDRLDVGNLDEGLTREGQLKVGIHADVEEFRVRLINDTASPSTITSGAWDIRVNSRYRLS